MNETGPDALNKCAGLMALVCTSLQDWRRDKFQSGRYFTKGFVWLHNMIHALLVVLRQFGPSAIQLTCEQCCS